MTGERKGACDGGEEKRGTRELLRRGREELEAREEKRERGGGREREGEEEI